jgi:hypothetical protein
MTDTNSTQLKSIDDYMYGALAKRLVKAKEPEIAIDIMKKKYYSNDNTNPILALAFLEAYNSNDVLKTPVGQRISIEDKRYNEALDELSMEELVKSKLAGGLESKLVEAMIPNLRTGSIKSIKKLHNIYSAEINVAKAGFEKDMVNADGNKDTIQRFKEAYEQRIDGINKKYNAEKIFKTLRTLEEIEETGFRILQRNATLDSMYLPGMAIEDIEKVAQN